MYKQEEELSWLPPSLHHKPTKEVLDRIENKLNNEKEIPKDKK
jgi:hypothetical protein